MFLTCQRDQFLPHSVGPPSLRKRTLPLKSGNNHVAQTGNYHVGATFKAEAGWGRHLYIRDKVSQVWGPVAAHPRWPGKISLTHCKKTLSSVTIIAPAFAVQGDKLGIKAA
jgi:hypothetical protein